MPAAYTENVVSAGIKSFANETRVETTEIHGGGSWGALYICAGTAYVNDLTTYAFRGICVETGATVNVYDGMFTSAPFNTNFKGIEVREGTANIYDGTFLNRTVGERRYNNYGFMAVTGSLGVLNVFGGTFKWTAVNSEEATNQGALIRVDAAGGTVNVSEGVVLTFAGHDGYVFELVYGAVVNVTGATINVDGTKAIIVQCTNSYTDITFTDCAFMVSTEQGLTLCIAGTFKGNTLAVVPERTSFAAGVTINSYAQNVKYAGASYKIWVANEGKFTNNALSGAAVHVDTSNAETSGLRFETSISQTTVNAILGRYSDATLKYYTLIAPMDYVAAANGVFTKEALEEIGVTGTKYIAILAQNSLDTRDGVRYNGTLIGLNSYTRLYAAIPMIEVVVADEVVETIYGEFSSVDNARSAKQVANAIISDYGSEYWTIWTAEQRAIVDKYAGQ